MTGEFNPCSNSPEHGSGSGTSVPQPPTVTNFAARARTTSVSRTLTATSSPRCARRSAPAHPSPVADWPAPIVSPPSRSPREKPPRVGIQRARPGHDPHPHPNLCYKPTPTPQVLQFVQGALGQQVKHPASFRKSIENRNGPNDLTTPSGGHRRTALPATLSSTTCAPQPRSRHQSLHPVCEFR